MEIYIKIFVCGSVRFWKINPKSNPIQAVFTKCHPNTSNNIRFCAVFGFFDRFAVLIWIGLDLNTPRSDYDDPFLLKIKYKILKEDPVSDADVLTETVSLGTWNCTYFFFLQSLPEVTAILKWNEGFLALFQITVLDSGIRNVKSIIPWFK